MATDPRDVLDRPAEWPDAVVRYGDHPDQLVDVSLPPGPAQPRPLLVLLHGGFWRQEWDRRHTRPMATALRGLGYVVVTPEYRRTGGDGGFPATFSDVAAVRSQLPSLISEVLPGRVDPAPPTLVGHSAGGQLALWWALSAAPAQAAAAVVALAPVGDLARGYAEGLGDGAVGALLGGSPSRYPQRYAAYDPAALLRRGEPGCPITVLHGSDDKQVPARHSRSLPRVRLVELAGVDHFALIDPLSDAWPEVISALVRSAR